MEKKKQSKFGLWISRIVFVVALAVFVYSAYKIYEYWSVGNQIAQETDEVMDHITTGETEPGTQTVVFQPDWQWLKSKNPEIVGFIVIPDTEIFYPIVYRANDNSYYLNKTAFLQSNEFGAIFIDGNSSGNLQSPDTIIYGHNVSGRDTMFTQLSKFFEPEFAETHPYIYIFTPEGNYRAEVVSAYRSTTEDAIYAYRYNSYESISAYMESARAKSELVWDGEYPLETNYITLSTCSFDYGVEGTDLHRYLVHAALIPWDGELEVPVK